MDTEPAPGDPPARPGLPAGRRVRIASAAVVAAFAWAALYALGLYEGVPAKGLDVAGRAAANGQWVLAACAWLTAYGMHALPAVALVYLLVAAQAAAGVATPLTRALLPRLIDAGPPSWGPQRRSKGE